MQKIISILVPSYNRPDYLSSLLHSIYNSNCLDKLEVVVCDDNSPHQEEIRKVCESYANRNNFRYYLSDENVGEIENKRKLLQYATGEYICFIGDDDILYHKTLDAFISKQSYYNYYDLLLFGFNVINDHGEYVSSRKAHISYEIKNNDSKIKQLIYRASSLPLWHFHPATYICRRNVAISLGFSSDFGMAEDLNFIWESLKSNIRTRVVNDVLFAWRKHQTVAQVNQSKIPLNNLNARWCFLDAVRSGVHAEDVLGLSDRRLIDHLVLGPVARDLTTSTITKTQVRSMFGGKLNEYKRIIILLNVPKLYLLYYNVIRIYAFLHTFGFRELLHTVRNAMENENTK